MPNSTIEESYGKWKSLISAKDIAKKTINFGDIQIDNGKIYWNESRPWAQGRFFIVSCDPNALENKKDETTQEFNIAANVHGYGGGAFIVHDNVIYFNDTITGHVYKKDLIKSIISKVTQDNGFSYADFSVDKLHNFLYCLRSKTQLNTKFPITEIVRIEIKTGNQEVLFTGADFYSNVRVSPDGQKLLFLQWNYPNMPWDENELWVAEMDSTFKVTNLTKLFHKQKVSVYQPEFGMDNTIYCAADINNYWNILKLNNNNVTNLFEYQADFARPLWVAGSRTFSFISDHEIITNCCEKGIWKTFLLNMKTNSQTCFDNKLTCFYNMTADKNFIVFIGGNEFLPLSIMAYPTNSAKTPTYLQNQNQIQTLATSQIEMKLISNDISTPELIAFKSRNNNVYAFYYPPKNAQYSLNKNEAPPCIIKIHGGPTAAADFMFNPKIQFYTSRGFAYVEINYSGSSGYGREYRDRLNAMWGIIDVDDCISCAEYLSEKGLANKNKIVLSGSSSGGFTLLNILTKTNIFSCASCHYGIGDLISLANDIHKFEACYDQNLLGGTIESNVNLYQERSPINYAKNIKTPVVFFHGDKDNVVHMSQTIQMAEALKVNNIYHEVYIFEGEGHGFKKEETIISVLEKELAFFNKILERNFN